MVKVKHNKTSLAPTKGLGRRGEKNVVEEVRAKGSVKRRKEMCRLDRQVRVLNIPEKPVVRKMKKCYSSTSKMYNTGI